MSSKWDWEYLWSITPTMVGALGLTALVTVLASCLALVLGLLWAMLNRVHYRPVTLASRLVLEFVRGTPLLVQVFLVFYILPDYGVALSAFMTGVLVLGVHIGAYMAEVYRAGIDGIPKEQWEASAALGLSPARTMLRIVLPPALRNSVPALANYVIAMYKETAVLFAIGVPVLLYMARIEGNLSYRFLESYTLAGVLYLLVSYPSSRFLRRFEVARG